MMLGKIEDSQKRGQQSIRWLDSIIADETYAFKNLKKSLLIPCLGKIVFFDYPLTVFILDIPIYLE